MWFENIFTPSLLLAVYPFNKAEDFFVRSNLLIFPFEYQAFSDRFKNYLPNPRYQRFSPMFPSKSYVVLHFHLSL